MEITVDTVTGRNITLKFENPELVKHVNIRVKTEMLIFVETGGEKLELKVERTQTVGSLKQLIVQMRKNMSSICSLQYLGKNLLASKTLADYDVKEGSILQVVTNPTIPNTQQQQQQQQQVVTNPTIPNIQQQQEVVTNPTIPNMQPQQQVVTNPTIPNMQFRRQQQVVASPTVPNMLNQQQQQKWLQLGDRFGRQFLQLCQKQRAEALAFMNAEMHPDTKTSPN